MQVPHPPPLLEYHHQLEQMKQTRSTFNTTQIRRRRYYKGVVGGKPRPALQQESQGDDKSMTALYSVMDTYSASAHDTRRPKNRTGSYGAAGREISSIAATGNRVGFEVEDPILCFIMVQRAKIGQTTHAKRRPEAADCLTTTSIHVAGIKDLKLFSKKILQLQSEEPWNLEEPHVSGANEFIYALGRVGGDGKPNPYDLFIVGPDKAMTQNRYYTISAFNVSEVRYCCVCCVRSVSEDYEGYKYWEGYQLRLTTSAPSCGKRRSRMYN